MTWIMTGTGRKIDFVHPDPEQITLVDISMALSRNHRFGGHSPMKVGQHVLEVMTLMMQRARAENPDITEKELAEIALVGLLHDFPEFAVCDVPTPLKRLLGSVYTTIENRLLDAMLDKWNLRLTYLKYADLLKWADQEAVEQEATRFKLDGYFMNDSYEYIKVPNAWVPEDKEVTLRSEIWNEEFIQSALTLAFIRFMFVSDRWLYIGGNWANMVMKDAAAVNRTVYDFVTDPSGVPSLLIDGPSEI